MAFADWKNVPDMLIGKTIEKLSGVQRDRITFNFTDGTSVRFVAITESKNIAPGTVQTIRELLVTPNP